MSSGGGIVAGPTPASAHSSGGGNVEWHVRPPNPKNPVVFFDVSIGGIPAGRIKMELFAVIAPKTAENFRQFCTRELRYLRWDVGMFQNLVLMIIERDGVWTALSYCLALKKKKLTFFSYLNVKNAERQGSLWVTRSVSFTGSSRTLWLRVVISLRSASLFCLVTSISLCFFSSCLLNAHNVWTLAEWRWWMHVHLWPQVRRWEFYC